MFVYYFDVIESGVGPQNYTFGSGCPARPMTFGSADTTKSLMSFPKCRSVEVINNPARPGSNHREVNCINYN